MICINQSKWFSTWFSIMDSSAKMKFFWSAHTHTRKFRNILDPFSVYRTQSTIDNHLSTFTNRQTHRVRENEKHWMKSIKRISRKLCTCYILLFFFHHIYIFKINCMLESRWNWLNRYTKWKKNTSTEEKEIILWTIVVLFRFLGASASLSQVLSHSDYLTMLYLMRRQWERYNVTIHESIFNIK